VSTDSPSMDSTVATKGAAPRRKSHSQSKKDIVYEGPTSDNGLSFFELKKILRTKGYDVSKHSPSLKRKLNSLVSQGVLVRRTDRKGSTVFVVQKYQDVKVFGTSNKKGRRTKQLTRAERRRPVSTSVQTKGAAKQGRGQRWKTQEARRLSQRYL
uniref:H15 domain-containing protein n=1 Tax=Anolis carolinensis TaxID=28377 RepID=A0A803T6F3_ANOCA